MGASQSTQPQPQSTQPQPQLTQPQPQLTDAKQCDCKPWLTDFEKRLLKDYVAMMPAEEADIRKRLETMTHEESGAYIRRLEIKRAMMQFSNTLRKGFPRHSQATFYARVYSRYEADHTCDAMN